MIKIKNIEIGENKPLVLIAGPCVVESEQITFETAEAIKQITSELNIPFIFKSSYKKANRTSYNSFTGLGDEIAIQILKRVKSKYNIPIITDVHSADEAYMAAEVVDLLQIPAFLCRQSDLLIAAGKTGKPINIKKGQFLHPADMKFAADKVKSTGNKNILLTERGSSFGYNNLVVDMRSLVIMKELGYPIVMDATHSVQMPGLSGITGGNPQYILPLARAATAVGIDALFLEVHPDPKTALSDAASQLPLDSLKELLIQIQNIDKVIKNYA